jgi:hypothetical protein
VACTEQSNFFTIRSLPCFLFIFSCPGHIAELAESLVHCHTLGCCQNRVRVVIVTLLTSNFVYLDDEAAAANFLRLGNGDHISNHDATAYAAK